MRRRVVSLVATLAPLVAAGCAVRAEPGWERQLEGLVGAFVDTATLATPVPDVDPTVGDSVTFDVRLVDGADPRTWGLRLEVVRVEPKAVLFWRGIPDFELRVTSAERQRRQAAAREKPPDLSELYSERPVARVRVRAFDASGEDLGIGESDVIVARLRRGLLPACRAGHRRRELMRGRVAAGREAPLLTVGDDVYQDIEAVGEGVAACELFFQILKDNPVTRQILFDVLALPSWWSILTNWGVRVSFSVDFFAAEHVDPTRFPGESRELWSVPLTVLLNGQPGLLARVIVGPAGSPDGVAAGVYGIVARHPSDADRRLVLTLRASGHGG